MDAPTYPAAAAFELPLAASYTVQLENTSLAELMDMPDAWNIVLRHMPMLKMMTSSPMMKPHLGNMTVQALSAFVEPPSPEQIAAIDRELASLSLPREQTQ